MNRITALFEQKDRSILSVYYTAGFPHLNDTLLIAKELEKQGVDMIEIGIPFSDPMADGPIIQTSSYRALKNGMSLSILFEQLKEMRKELHLPIILMGYLNPVMQYGFESFCKKCREVGVDGLILPDLPMDIYLSDYKTIADREGILTIMLITPETQEERIQLIDKSTDGFVYMVSSASTTGAQNSFDEVKQTYFSRIDKMKLKNPRLVGFGISNKATFDMACNYAQGAIVGSQFVELLQQYEDNIPKAVESLLKKLKA